MSAAGAALPIAAVLTDQDVSPGVLGFVVVALLGVATWLLVRSMQRQIKKIDLPDDDDARPDPPPPVPAEPDTAAQDRASEDG
jgi:hypothetical protein